MISLFFFLPRYRSKYLYSFPWRRAVIRSISQKTFTKRVRENENESNEIMSQTQSESGRLHPIPFYLFDVFFFPFCRKKSQWSLGSPSLHVRRCASGISVSDRFFFFFFCLFSRRTGTDEYAERDENIDRSLSWTGNIENHRDKLKEATKAFMSTTDFKKGWRSSAEED